MKEESSYHLVLEDIGNLLGKYIKSDNDRKEQGLFTYARICVEIDLSKGLPDRLQMKHESSVGFRGWTVKILLLGVDSVIWRVTYKTHAHSLEILQRKKRGRHLSVKIGKHIMFFL